MERISICKYPDGTVWYMITDNKGSSSNPVETITNEEKQKILAAVTKLLGIE